MHTNRVHSDTGRNIMHVNDVKNNYPHKVYSYIDPKTSCEYLVFINEDFVLPRYETCNPVVEISE